MICRREVPILLTVGTEPVLFRPVLSSVVFIGLATPNGPTQHGFPGCVRKPTVLPKNILHYTYNIWTAQGGGGSFQP